MTELTEDTCRHGEPEDRCAACAACAACDGSCGSCPFAAVLPDALDSLPIAALLHSRLTSWFGDDRQSFLVSDLVPVVTQIVSEFQHSALEMARKADLAERRAEEAELHVEQLRDALDREADLPGCDHHWLDRPESDTRECLICGTEVSG